MKHESIAMDMPIEFIEVNPINPLISKCQIKVCYVGDEPNRNRSVISKETALKLANSIPGSPIVGFFNQQTQDFEEHNKIIDTSTGKLRFTENTRPYGFVDLGAKVWFQKFLDDGVEHEYLVTEGYLWTGQYPECERILEHGNNQSMELDQKNLQAFWSKDTNGKPEFFIINEAIMSKLCILGEDYEPCFEGAQITKTEFSFNEFKQELFSLMNQMKKILEEEGGASVFSKMDIEIGGSLWNAIYAYANNETKYSIYGVFEDDGQIFAVLQNDEKTYRVNFSYAEDAYQGDELVEFELTEDMGDAQFSEEAIAAYEKSLEPEEEPVVEVEPAPAVEPAAEPEVDVEPAAEPIEAPIEEPKVEFKVEESEEYIKLATDYAALVKTNQALNEQINSLNETVNSLTEFKNKVERQEKQAMIDSFYMLSQGDKADVIANIDKYSIDDIEAKLSIICVRNRVSFDTDDSGASGAKTPSTYSLNDVVEEDEVGIPAWVSAVRAVAKARN